MVFEKVFEYTQGLHVLYVEDDQDLLLETKDILEDLFANVDTAVNGKEALEKYTKHHQKKLQYYDLIITDINMPVMDGLELIKKIHSLYEEQSIIVISAYNESSRLTNLIQEGITSFIMKPLDPTAFMNMLYKTAKSISNQKKLVEYQNELEKTNQTLDKKVRDLTKEIFCTQQISIEAIANMVESYDDETGTHVKRIEAYTTAMIANLHDSTKELRDSAPFCINTS